MQPWGGGAAGSGVGEVGECAGTSEARGETTGHGNDVGFDDGLLLGCGLLTSAASVTGGGNIDSALCTVRVNSPSDSFFRTSVRCVFSPKAKLRAGREEDKAAIWPVDAVPILHLPARSMLGWHRLG